MNNKKLFFLFFVGIFLFSLVQASSIGTFKQGQTMQITNYCETGDCSYMNLTSLEYPNGTIIYLNSQMEEHSQMFNYSYTPMDIGEYTFKTCADPDGDLTCESDTFSVTKTGFTLKEGESLIYFILAFGVFVLFLISMYFLVKIPYKNSVDQQGYIIKISKLKYVKLGLILLSWVLFTWFLNILIGLSDNFVTLTMYYGFFGFIFDVMNRLALPLGIIIIVIAFFEIIRDSNIQKEINKFGSSFR